MAAASCTKPITVAAPVMSWRMYSMPSAGLIEMPPESKVMPLPTTASVFVAPGAVYFIATNAAAGTLPWLTARMAFMPWALQLVFAPDDDLEAVLVGDFAGLLGQIGRA